MSDLATVIPPAVLGGPAHPRQDTPGLDGLDKMKSIMAKLRKEPPTEISGTEVLKIRDYSDGSITVPALGVVGETHIKGSNVLYFELDDGCNFIVRPSGTEPKIKTYFTTLGKDLAEAEAQEKVLADALKPILA